jgi:hypothetical protein
MVSSYVTKVYVRLDFRSRGKGNCRKVPALYRKRRLARHVLADPVGDMKMVAAFEYTIMQLIRR